MLAAQWCRASPARSRLIVPGALKDVPDFVSDALRVVVAQDFDSGQAGAGSACDGDRPVPQPLESDMFNLGPPSALLIVLDY